MKTVPAHAGPQECQNSFRGAQKLLQLISNLPVAHGSVGWFDDKSLLLAFPAQLCDVVLELSVLGGEDPGFGYEAVLLRLALDHSTETEREGGSNKTSPSTPFRKSVLPRQLMWLSLAVLKETGTLLGRVSC